MRPQITSVGLCLETHEPGSPLSSSPLCLEPRNRDRVVEICGQRCLEVFPFVRARMLEAQFPCVQHLPGEIFPKSRRIQFVTKNRMAKMLKMHADLMSASGVQAAFDQACLIACTNHAVLSPGCPSAQRSHSHALAMDGMASDVFFNCAGRLAQFSSNQREINFFDPARCELFRQFLMRSIILGYDEAAARFFIQAVDNTGPFFSSDA